MELKAAGGKGKGNIRMAIGAACKTLQAVYKLSTNPTFT